jgi:uncharacterized protein (DUF983 family)
MARSYHSRSDDHAGFNLIILLAGTVWVHRVVLTRIERYLPSIWMTIVVIVGLVIIIKLGTKLIR